MVGRLRQAVRKPKGVSGTSIVATLSVLVALSLLSLGSSETNIMLRVAFQPDLPPYQFLDGSGKAVGVHADILNSIAKHYNMVIEYIPMDTNAACLEALESGEVDIALGIHSGFRHSNKVTLTTAVSQSQVCLISPNERATDIRSDLGTGYFRAAIENGLVEYFALRDFRNLHSRIVPNQRETFDLLVERKVDMAIGVKDSLTYQLELAGLDKEYTIVNNYLFPVDYTMAVLSTDSTLLRQLNNGISQIGISGDYERIHAKWIGSEDMRLQVLTRRVAYVLLALSGTAGVIILTNVRVNAALKRQVSLQTQELRTANKRLQTQIIETRNTNELRNQIVEDNPNGIIVFNTDFLITVCNSGACNITGIDHSPIGRSIYEVDLLRPLIERKEDQWFAPDAEFSTEDITTRDENDNAVIYRCDIKRLYDGSGGIRGIILSIKNVTKERKSRELFYERERDRALGQMVASIAHEIRNPLTSIKTYVGLIPTKKDSPQFQEQMARYLPKELDRIDSLVQNFINYAKPQSQKRQPVLVDEVLGSCGSLIGYSVSSGIELGMQVEKGLVIEANPSQLRQIMINLILNGLEAMEEKLAGRPAGQQLHMQVRAYAEGDEVVITVRDEGCGMQGAQVERACEPFFTTKSHGTGLGLPISKQYTEENGGTLSIESQKDKFTEITLRFKRYQA